MTLYHTATYRHRGRHRYSADAGPPTTDPLFGAGVRAASGWVQHDGARVDLGFWTVALRLPRLVGGTFKLAWDAGRWVLPFALAANVLAGATAAVLLLAANQALTELLSGPPTRTQLIAALPELLTVAAAGAIRSVLSSAGRAASGRLEPRVDRLAYTRLLERAIRVELAVLQDAEFHNLLAAAHRGALSARQVTAGIVGLAEAAAGLIASATVLAVLHPLLLPLLIAVVLPPAWGAVRAARARFMSFKRWTELNRQLEMLSDLLTSPSAAEEVRAHQTGDFLLGHYRRLSELAEREQARLATREAGTLLVADGAAGVARVATYGTLGLLLATGAVPLAVAGTAVLAVRTGTQSLTSLVTAMNDLYEDGLFVRDWQHACERAEAEAMRSGSVQLANPPKHIEARNLTFGYPNAMQPALQGIDVVVRQGEVVALVGDNGSGKSTLAKLLVGLYLPTEGQVLWDGCPTGELNRASMFQNVALVSQGFVQWPFTTRVNVTIGRPTRPPLPDVLAEAARFGRADEVIDRLAQGWDTLLAREFWGGTELSGGQWQRIGLARAHFRNAQVVIFDEPTAALDPRTEIEVFDRVRRLADDGRSVVLVTHRLASVRCADRIYVLADGQMVEHGTHGALMTLDGRYADLYRLQMRQHESTT
ncbi:ABC transporter ATP-binding protein [Asanoa siamensis]|uniref:Multidrug ABC transporter permease n=1 Tax=Asanoa siamensis TaxID=926357 RepID=A0ABQ4CQJ6_9ACTN|nr:ABC transporter ATP-binding protein [Asanoa siamensis]GIF73571.1 multidrug ABC transporter permease [Asanoa siamensis]